MKKLLGLLLLCGSYFTVAAQKEMQEGYIKLEVTDVQSDNPEVMQAAEMMKGGSMEVYFTTSKMRSDMTMGMMMKTKTFINVAEKKSYSFMDMMGKKIKMVSDLNATQEKNEKVENIKSEMEFKVKKFDQVTKTILGYTCTKTEVTMIRKDGESMKMTYYTTNAIKVPHSLANLNRGMGQKGPKMPEIGGFPLEMTIAAGPMNLTYTAVKVSEKVYDKDFEMPTGYKETTEEEMGKMFGGGRRSGGGGGF